MERYDVIVVGSDEVWNLRHPWYGGRTLFFGDGVQADRLVSYAASFGTYPAREGLAHVRTGRLRDFDSISVRDDNSQTILRRALGYEPALVLDPCLQFLPRTGEPWRRAGGTWPGVDVLDRRELYVVVYGHNFSGWCSSEVRRWAKGQGSRLVSIGYRNDWAEPFGELCTHMPFFARGGE